MNSREYVDLPFQDQGRGPNGYDCWGLVRLVYWREWGIDLPSYTEHYISATERAEVSALIAERDDYGWQYVPAGEEREGDLIGLRIRGEPGHIGLVVEPGYMLHIHANTASVVEPYRGIIWKNRIEEFARWAQ